MRNCCDNMQVRHGEDVLSLDYVIRCSSCHTQSVGLDMVEALMEWHKTVDGMKHGYLYTKEEYDGSEVRDMRIYGEWSELPCQELMSR